MDREKIVKMGVILLMVAGVVLAVIENLHKPKIYEGVGEGFEGEIKTKVTMTQNSQGEITITSMEISHGDTPEIAGPAIEELKRKIVEKPLKGELDDIAGATYTSKGCKMALEDSIKKFKDENSK